MHIALYVDFYAPYHYARLAQLQRDGKALNHHITGVELGGSSTIYGWARSSVAPDSLTTLFPQEKVQDISGLRIWFAVKRYIVENHIDVLVVPSYWPVYTFAACMAAKIAGAKVIMTVDSHYSSNRQTPWILAVKRLLLSYADGFVVAGSPQSAFLKDLGIEANNIFDGYDVVDNERFSTLADAARADDTNLRNVLQLPKRYILSLGRFVSKKNLFTILQAYKLSYATKATSGVHLVFVGSGPEKDALIAKAIEQKLFVYDHSFQMLDYGQNKDSAVHFYPFAQIDRAPAYFALADCFVLASPIEEWGLVVNEAMAARCVPIVSQSAGCSYDLIKSGVTGLNFEASDVHALARAIQMVCADEIFRLKLADAARVHIQLWGLPRFSRSIFASIRLAVSGWSNKPAV